MKKEYIFIIVISLLTEIFPSFSQTILTQVDSIQISGASIWGGISYDGHRINVTTMSGGQINLIKFDTALNQIGSMKALTTNSDVPSGTIADHKHVFINDHSYITFSNTGDEGLFLFCIDTSGNRVGNLDTVAFNFTGASTNDMIITTDSMMLSLLHFYPNFQNWVYQYDFNLNKLSGPVATSSTLPHNNIGNAIFYKDTFHLFTGSQFGTNSNLILTKWNADWTPAASYPQTIIASSGGDGKWFANGIAENKYNEQLYIGYHHIYNGQNPGKEHIDISVLDKNLNVLETQHVTNESFFRPHFLLLHGYLYMIYDGAGVYIKKYKVSTQLTTSITNNAKPSSSFDSFFNENTKELFIYSSLNENYTISIFSTDGKEVVRKVLMGKNNSLNLSEFKSGLYIFNVYSPRLTIKYTAKMVLTN